MPKDETSTISITSVKASTTDKNAIVKVEVFRPTGLPVVTGTVRFYPNATNRPENLLDQRVDRSASGAWTLTIKGLPAGTGQVTLALLMPLVRTQRFARLLNL